MKLTKPVFLARCLADRKGASLREAVQAVRSYLGRSLPDDELNLVGEDEQAFLDNCVAEFELVDGDYARALTIASLAGQPTTRTIQNAIATAKTILEANSQQGRPPA